MADETKTNIFARKESTDKDAVVQNEGVTEQEAQALDGAGGPNLTPAFVKRDFEDENVQLTDSDDLESAKEGAAAHGGSTDQQLDLVGLEAAQAAGPELEGQEDTVQFTSTPIASLRLGKYQFKNGVLRLSAEDAADFEELLGKAAIRTKQVVRKIDRRGGEAIARRYLEQTKSRSTAGVDTSDKGPRAPNPVKTEA